MKVKAAGFKICLPFSPALQLMPVTSGRLLLLKPVPFRELRVLPLMPLAPLENTLNEAPDVTLTMLFDSQPPTVFCTNSLWLASFGR